MNFKEWYRIQESPSLFGGDIWRQTPGTARVNPKNWDMMMPGSGGAVNASPSASGGGAASLFTGSGPGLGNQQPKRMKKMEKK